LIRGVPEVPADRPAARIHTSLAPDALARTAPWLGRRVGRTALAEYGAGRRLPGATEASAALGLDAAEAGLVADLTERSRGTLRASVQSGHPTRGGVLVGALVWVATEAGWVELVPSDVDTVELRPVARELIGTRLAPFIAQILEAGDDAA